MPVDYCPVLLLVGYSTGLPDKINEDAWRGSELCWLLHAVTLACASALKSYSVLGGCMNFEELLSTLTPEIVVSLKRAVELGKWPDGRVLTRQQREHSLQAVLAWEVKNLPEEQRTGYMPQSCKSSETAQSAKPVGEQETILRFQDA